MENQPKRKRGGQPGNRNALKHGYYAKFLTHDQQRDFLRAADVNGLDEEIALLRTAIKNAATGGDLKNLKALLRSVIVLDKLVRTRFRIGDNKLDQFEKAVGVVRRDILIPLGVGAAFGSSVAGENQAGRTPLKSQKGANECRTNLNE